MIKSLLYMTTFGIALITQSAQAADRSLALNSMLSSSGEKRVALVIGNGAYLKTTLKNPVNDAQDIANKLRDLGFDVIERENLHSKQIGGALRDFKSKLVPGSVALFFYAGHGLQIKGENYLPAVDAEINSEEDVPNQSLAVRQLMELLDESKTRLNLVFLDACRNNPYSRSFRSLDGNGLARVSAPSGTLISYSTRPGSVADDGEGRNGLYTSKLLAQIDSNQQIEQVLKHVVMEVKISSHGRQEPWMEGSIAGDFCFVECGGSNEPRAEKNNKEVVAVTVDLKVSSDDRITQGSSAKKHKEGNNFEMVVIPGKNYEIGRYEVTQAEWKSIMGTNPSSFNTCGDDCPVEKVSWDDIQKFLHDLNEKTGKQFRLPSETEWEYACYGGTRTEFCGGNDVSSVAWFNGNSSGSTHPVGQKQANNYELYDMSGNVWEWMNDCYHADCKQRVLRGGAWDRYPGNQRSISRYFNLQSDQDINIGFRLARSLP
jgi:formylglycine-generating enzyme required for sulfatase activity